MSTHRYPPSALRGDYARAGLGLALTLGPAAMVQPGSGALWVLLPLALLFAVFALRTLGRQLAVVELGPDGITVAGLGRSALRWDEIRSFRLDYYSTRGDRTGGWMQLTAKGPSGKIRVDSALEDFRASLLNSTTQPPDGLSGVELAVDPYFPRTIPSVSPALSGRSAHRGGRNRLMLDGSAAWFRDNRLN